MHPFLKLGGRASPNRLLSPPGSLNRGMMSVDMSSGISSCECSPMPSRTESFSLGSPRGMPIGWKGQSMEMMMQEDSLKDVMDSWDLKYIPDAMEDIGRSGTFFTNKPFLASGAYSIHYP